ncbi:MAG: hypothetical protein JNG88_16055 [Phycisphaerales bacterium]|nr:hypothetical protein [Phycisphaerales bacterium]
MISKSRRVSFFALISGLSLATLSGGCPPLLAPADGDANQSGRSAQIAPRRISPSREEGLPTATLVLSWTAVPGAGSYAVFFGVDSNPPFMARVRNSSITVRDLPDCKEHYWRVVAENGDETVSSPTWTFVTRCD